jgi:hypothetical protein
MKDIIRMNQLAGIITEGQARKIMAILNEVSHDNADMRTANSKTGLEAYILKDKTNRTLTTKKAVNGEEFLIVTDKKEGWDYWFEKLDDAGDKVKFYQKHEL